MKKTQLLFMAAMMIAAFVNQKAEAKIWRVNNKSNYNGNNLFGDNYGGTAGFPVFARVQDAHNLGSTGDTIYVEGSVDTYSGADITKKLVIIGGGYFLDENPKTSNNQLSSKIAYLNFISNSTQSSSGSIVIGLNVVGYFSGNDGAIYVNVDGITISRCRIENTIAFASGLQDVTITQSFFSNIKNNNALSGSGGGGFVPPTDIIFNDNICQKTLLWSSNAQWEILQCNNNIFDGPPNTLNLQFLATDFKNNILKSTNAGVNISNGTNSNVEYNIGTLSSQFGTANNNLIVADMTTIFVGTAGQSTDGQYQLKPGSPASGNGSDGTDRGAFGGAVVSKQYTLSGLAPIPVIYKVSTPGATSTNLPVTIQARTIK